jgi:hypothetical protein
MFNRERTHRTQKSGPQPALMILLSMILPTLCLPRSGKSFTAKHANQREKKSPPSEGWPQAGVGSSVASPPPQHQPVEGTHRFGA